MSYFNWADADREASKRWRTKDYLIDDILRWCDNKEFYDNFWRGRHEHTIDIECEVIAPKQLPEHGNR